YISEINPALYIDSNKNIPVVLIPYYIPFLMEDWTVNNRLAVLAWKNLVNHESCAEAWAKTHKLKGTNYAVTGLPVMDDLLVPKEEYEDVWPCKDGRRRIIYSPHHTIADIHWEGIAYSTFLDYCQFMLDLREKYRDKVYFVFKPHPSLKYRLYKIWGEEKTDEYYSRWDVPGVSHVEQGQYMALFKHSDALIHDCGSFTLEYMYTGNPVMYLVRDEHRTDNLTPCAKEAFDLHYKAYSEKDI
ncbi:MAG: CDP-glycerol glycerophosphotransferase family protein, partial [Bacteroidales bacterium]|nr:CDP-glycerol glycerophosphotransferase family protein [Bacteroidales bacterium]